MEDSRTTRTFHCPQGLWMKFRKYSLDKNTTASDLIRGYIEKTLKEGGHNEEYRIRKG